MPNCTFSLGNEKCTCSASYVLIPTPKQDNKKAEKMIQDTLYCCKKCVDHMKQQQEHDTFGDILGYVPLKKYSAFRQWKNINESFQNDGYVVLRHQEFVQLLKKLDLSTPNELFLNKILDIIGNIKAEKLFTIKTKGTQKCTKDQEKRRQW